MADTVSHLPRVAVLSLAILCCTTLEAVAETVQIPGPEGALEGEAIAVPGADHALIIIPGSGPIDRDGNGIEIGMQTDTYRLLAEALAAEGIASIRIDKRGFGGSEGAIADPGNVSISGYADDTRGWIGKALELAPCVWLAGHSEGGLVALVAASNPPEGLCGLILMSTGGRPTGRILVEQMQANPAAELLLPELESIVAGLEAGKTRDVATISEALQGLFAPGMQAYMVDLFAYNPQAVARSWPGPVLVLQGDHDIQIKMLDAAMLATAMPQAERRDLAGATHMLKPDQPGEPFATYSDPALPLHPDLVPAIVEFLAAQGG